jgi:Galactose-3-O-sulfotransferase
MWISRVNREKKNNNVRLKKRWASTAWIKVALVMGMATLPSQYRPWILDINTVSYDDVQRRKREMHSEGITYATNISNTSDEQDAFDVDSFILQLGSSTDKIRGIIARPFEAWPKGSPLPCFRPHELWKDDAHQSTPATKGFFYLKPYKTGSSTTSGVHLRIARNIAKRRKKQKIDICETRFAHGPDLSPGYTLFHKRIAEKSFLWTVVRDPTQRAISHFFHFMVSRKKMEPTDQNFISFLRDESFPIQDYYYHALYTKDIFNRETHKPTSVANHILRTYNFIGITERMDESFVALMMILRLRISDILYLSAKTKGGYDDAGGKKSGQTCTYIWPSFVSPGMEIFFNSSEWKDMIRYDRLLYEAVNRSLDLTIDQLGRERFENKLRTYREAQKFAQKRCLPNTTFPCDASGRFHRENTTDCIWKDSGCGVTCLDQIATELNLW